jgi:hypothetical protein
MPAGSPVDRKMLSGLTEDERMELFFTHIRSVWAVDGLYFLGIERKFGTAGATEIDRGVWEEMAVIEAKRLKKCLNLGGSDLKTMMRALQFSSWALDLEEKEVVVDENAGRAVLRNLNCRTQNTRIKKGLGEFPCKPVRSGYLVAFAREFNPKIEVACMTCPPDRHPADLWCEWEFTLR